jgi:hypothetical protein
LDWLFAHPHPDMLIGLDVENMLGSELMRKLLRDWAVKCQEDAKASCCTKDERGTCGAALVRGRLQTAVSSCSPMAVVVNVVVKSKLHAERGHTGEELRGARWAKFVREALY